MSAGAPGSRSEGLSRPRAACQSVPVRSVPRDLSLKVKAKARGSAGEQLSATGSLCQATERVLGHHILLLLLHPPACPVSGEQLGGGQCW